MENLIRDLRFGARMLLRSPGITAIAILALALGIGANSAIFSVVNAVLLRPLPVREPDRLVTIAMDSKLLNVTGAQPGFSIYALWREHGQSFASVTAAASDTAVVGAFGAEQPAKLWRVAATFLPTFGVSPAIGRDFLPGEDLPGAPRVAILSDPYWRARCNADPRIVGTLLKIDGEPATVVGVLPPGFHVNGRPADIYAPIARSLNSKEWLSVDIYARLKPGVTIEQAQAEVDAHASRLDRGPFKWRERLWYIRDFQVRDVRLSLWVLLGAVALVLLIACANTATLLLARASARQNEVAVRTALGAGSSRIVRQMLTESIMLSLAGGVAGVLVALACVRLVPLLAHERLPGLLEQTRVDGAVLAFTLLLSLLTGVVFGLAPALAARKMNVFETLKEGGRAGFSVGRRRGWNCLVVTETALALVLVIGATLLVQTFFYLRDVAPGFRVDTLLTARITPPPNKFKSRDQCIEHWRAVMDRVRAIPGVESATFAQNLPMTGENTVGHWNVEGQHFSRPSEAPVMWFRNTESDYFRTMQMSLRKGRVFTERDNAAAPRVAVVNESFARRFWPHQDPIGKHLGGDDVPVHEVIGVVGDVRVEESTKAAPLEVFFHYLQAPPARIALAIRVDPRAYSKPLLLGPAVDRAVTAIDKDQRVTHIAEMRQLISDRIAPKRLSAQLISVFAALALILAAVGIYALLSFSVVQRTHEIGVRVALGAGRVQVLSMVASEAALLAGIGVVMGIGIALAFLRVVKALVYGVSATDPLLYAGTSAALFGIAMLAALLPAWRATRVDPLVALRQQ